jgi:hypothetical protein
MSCRPHDEFHSLPADDAAPDMPPPWWGFLLGAVIVLTVGGMTAWVAWGWL